MLHSRRNEFFPDKENKGKSKEAKLDGGGNPSPKKRLSGGSSERVPKKVCSEKFASDARLTAALTRRTTPTTVASTTRMASPSVKPQVSPPIQLSPTRSLGAIIRWLI